MMLESVVSPVVEAIGGAGVRAVRAYPKRPLCEKGAPLVCVSVARAKGVPAGLGSYLGVETDPVTGLGREIYGSRCELELALDIYVPADAEDAGEECMRCVNLVSGALRSLPEGIKISSLSFGEMAADPQTGRFLCRGTAAASAFFIAREAEGEGEFTDFILRGSVQG